jgi:hypothetical protein
LTILPPPRPAGGDRRPAAVVPLRLLQYGNIATGSTGTVRLANTDKKASLPANFTFRAADKGVHTFASLILRTKGNQKITMTDTVNTSLNANLNANVV